MLNLKQEELIQQFIADLRKNFPEATIVNVVPGPENPQELWIRVVAPENEQRLFELAEFSANRTMDILLDYGYYFLVVPTAKSEAPTNGSANGSSSLPFESEMMLNYKQEELIQQLADEIQQKFPEVRFIDVGPGADNPNDIWIRVTEPKEEARMLELMEFCSSKTTDILLDYGYHMLVMPTPSEVGLALKVS